MRVPACASTCLNETGAGAGARIRCGRQTFVNGHVVNAFRFRTQVFDEREGERESEREQNLGSKNRKEAIRRWKWGGWVGGGGHPKRSLCEVRFCAALHSIRYSLSGSLSLSIPFHKPMNDQPSNNSQPIEVRICGNQKTAARVLFADLTISPLLCCLSSLLPFLCLPLSLSSLSFSSVSSLLSLSLFRLRRHPHTWKGVRSGAVPGEIGLAEFITSDRMHSTIVLL